MKLLMLMVVRHLTCVVTLLLRLRLFLMMVVRVVLLRCLVFSLVSLRLPSRVMVISLLMVVRVCLRLLFMLMMSVLM